MQNIATSPESLRKRLIRFFEDVPDERRPLAAFVRELSQVAHPFVFGGLIRDVCLKGIKSFDSDVDIVVRIENQRHLDGLLEQHDHTRNKFGGYRIKVNRWLVDLWEFESTWAFREGLVEPECEKSLLRTTFFNWDSVLYDLSSRTLLHSDRYFDEITQKTLAINLETTPNQIGTLVRSLRMIVRERANTCLHLSHFISENLDRYTDEEILDYQTRFSKPLVGRVHLSAFRQRQEEWVGQETFGWLVNPQPSLFGDDLIHPS